MLKINMLGYTSLNVYLNTALLASVNLRPILNGPIRTSIHNFFAAQFKSRGAAGGGKWAPLTTATRKIKRQGGRARMGVGRRSNRLWASLVKRGGPEQYVRLENTEIEVGTQVQNLGFPYAVAMQEGWTQHTVFGRRRRQPKHIPARQLVPDELPEVLTGSWEELIGEYIAP